MIITNHDLNLSLFSRQTSVTKTEERQIDRSESKDVVSEQSTTGLVTPLNQLSSKYPELEQAAPESLLSEDSELRFIRLLFEAMWGKKIQHHQVMQNQQNSQQQSKTISMAMAFSHSHAERRSFGIDEPQPFVSERTTQISTQTTQLLQASAKLQLEDGSTIDLSFDSTLFKTRNISTQSQMLINGELVDPLVLTFSGSNVELSQKKVDFDLNADGEIDSMSYASGASAFLALDKNGNGQIDDGNELFGALSGNGFAELAHYDENQDGVIDESDSVFSKLRLSNLDAQGGMQLISLTEQRVGAIFLANLDASFNVLDGNDEITGIVRKNGLFLQDDFTPGLIQHIDIVV